GSVGAGDHQARSLAIAEQSGGTGVADADIRAAYYQRDGYITNTQIGQSVDDERVWSASARTRYRFDADHELTLEILADRHRDGAVPLVPLGGPLYSVQRSQEGETDSDLFGAALKWAAAVGAGQFTVVTSFTSWDLGPYTDWLVLPPPLASSLTQRQQTGNEELRMASDPQGALTWNLGTWASASRTTGTADRAIFGTIPYNESGDHFTADDAALFGDATLRGTSPWSLTAGLRTELSAKDYFQDE